MHSLYYFYHCAENKCSFIFNRIIVGQVLYRQIAGFILVSFGIFCVTSQSLIASTIDDPTRSFLSSSQTRVASKTLKLQGVFLRENERIAIINGKVYALGDQISSYRIYRIGEKDVELSKGGKRLILSLRENMGNDFIKKSNNTYE